MARQLRIEYAGAKYHVINRCGRRNVRRGVEAHPSRLLFGRENYPAGMAVADAKADGIQPCGIIKIEAGEQNEFDLE
jgi:hypothetical protein